VQYDKLQAYGILQNSWDSYGGTWSGYAEHSASPVELESNANLDWCGILGYIFITFAKCIIQCICCRRLDDYNEMIHHFLACISDHISLRSRAKIASNIESTHSRASLEIDKEALITFLADDHIRYAID